MENEKKMEESNGSERSKEWYNIYNIVKQIPRKEVNCDAVDATSAATMIEQLFLNLGNVDLHSNPDAQVWAKCFMETKEKNNWSIKDIDEGLMIGWFANAMMAVGDHIYQTKTVTEKGGKAMDLDKLKEEYEKCFMVLDKTEMKGTAVNAKLNDVFEWIEQKVKHDYSQLPTNEEIELWAMRTYKEYEEARWFEPLKIGAMGMRDLIALNSNVEKKPEDLGDKICTDNEDMDVKTVEEILKLCTALHDNPNTWHEEAGGVDLVRIKLEDILITLKEKKK